MIKSITNIEDVIEIYLESGSAWLRLKREEYIKSILKDNKSIQSLQDANSKSKGAWCSGQLKSLFHRLLMTAFIGGEV